MVLLLVLVVTVAAAGCGWAVPAVRALPPTDASTAGTQSYRTATLPQPAGGTTEFAALQTLAVGPVVSAPSR